MDVCCALTTPNYAPGVAALINSLIRHGFQGVVYVGHTQRLPEWFVAACGQVPAGVEVRPVALDTAMHLGYYKPYFINRILREEAGIDRLFFFDIDIVALARWSFFRQWADEGLALCQDFNFANLSVHHPWRKEWKRLLRQASLEPSQEEAPYANSGFVGAARPSFGLFALWEKVTEAFVAGGGEVGFFRQQERQEAIVGDQDLLAAALMAFSGPLALFGPEAMGFQHYAFTMLHGTESPKPWVEGALPRALQGRGVTRYRDLFEQYTASGPFRPYTPLESKIRRWELLAAKAVSRVWRG